MTFDELQEQIRELLNEEYLLEEALYEGSSPNPESARARLQIVKAQIAVQWEAFWDDDAKPK